MEGVAGCRTFRADRRGGRCLGADSAVISPARNILGGTYNPGDYAVVVGRSPGGLLAAVPWNVARSDPRRDYGELLRCALAGICL